MKLELKEITPEENNSIPNSVDNFKSFQDILACFEKQNFLFHNLEKEFILPSVYQILFTFSFLLFYHLSFTWVSLAVKIGAAYFFHKFIKKSKLEFPFSGFVYTTFHFLTTNNRKKYNKIKIYQEEKRKFLSDFFSLAANKEIILQYLYTFHQENEYRLSSHVYTEIDEIKSSIEKESYELAFEKIIAFKKRIEYIKTFN